MHIENKYIGTYIISNTKINIKIQNIYPYIKIVKEFLLSKNTL